MGAILGAAGAVAGRRAQAAGHCNHCWTYGQSAKSGPGKRPRRTRPAGAVAEGDGISKHEPVEWGARRSTGAWDRPSGSERRGRLRARRAPARNGTDPALVICRAMVVVWCRVVRTVGGFEHPQEWARPLNGPENELRSRNLRMLAVLAGLFLLPLAIAFWAYYGTDWRPVRTVNHGEL